tara:strand:- start:1290 stop:1496 length:207 start_codon:yes stop_codon:yes gene_type:complete
LIYNINNNEDRKMTDLFEATINIKCSPVREANSKEEFIINLINEYNNTCGELFEIDRSDIVVHTEEEL